MNKNQTKYHISLRILHWLMAFIIIGLLAIGYYMTGLERTNPNKSELISLHKSFGVLVLLLIILRIFARLKFKAPDLPKTIAKPQAIIAKTAQYLLYAFMVFVPLSGYLMSNSHNHAVYLFGLKMPTLVGQNEIIGDITHELHEILPYVMLAVILIHFAGAMKHHFFDKKENDVLRRMI